MWKIAIIDDDKQVLKGMKQAIPWDELGAEWVEIARTVQMGLSLYGKKNRISSSRMFICL